MNEKGLTPMCCNCSHAKSVIMTLTTDIVRCELRGYNPVDYSCSDFDSVIKEKLTEDNAK